LNSLYIFKSKCKSFLERVLEVIKEQWKKYDDEE